MLVAEDKLGLPPWNYVSVPTHNIELLIRGHGAWELTYDNSL
jgi:hypothetical protein